MFRFTIVALVLGGVFLICSGTVIVAVKSVQESTAVVNDGLINNPVGFVLLSQGHLSFISHLYISYRYTINKDC